MSDSLEYEEREQQSSNSSIVVESKLPAEARSAEDNWSGIGDPARRRKLQNRLHQRAWRK
jgi:hypothetical protein